MKHFTTFLFIAAILATAGCSSNVSDLEKNTKTAAETCGGVDKVESVGAEGFTCMD